jgi:hypothetical protein
MVAAGLVPPPRPVVWEPARALGAGYAAADVIVFCLIRVKTSLDLEDARRLAAEFVEHDNTVRLHGAVGYVTPADKLAGRAEAIWAARRQKLATADARRRARTPREGFAEARPPELQ